ncbi:MAG: GNAT family N-acetyltransferase [Planctomycetota bacterium]
MSEKCNEKHQSREGYYLSDNFPQSISASFYGDPHWYYKATASASNLGDHWWIDRVFVSEELRGRGFGKGLLTEVLDTLKAHGGSLVKVCPGGYNTPFREQAAFYRACGFEKVQPGMLERTISP